MKGTKVLTLLHVSFLFPSYMKSEYSPYVCEVEEKYQSFLVLSIDFLINQKVFSRLIKCHYVEILGT
jgi:hypothetical protein